MMHIAIDKPYRLRQHRIGPADRIVRMDASSAKQRAIAFFAAHYAGDIEAASAYCAPDFQSVVYAPVDLFPHLGLQRGKEWIAESIRTQNERFTSRRYDVIHALEEGGTVALFGSIRLVKRRDGRVIEFVSGDFFTFHDTLIETHRGVIDSFHLVEQLIGAELSTDLIGRIRDSM